MSLNKICVISAINSIAKDGKLLDYVQLASIAAERVKHYLNLDTVLITNDPKPAQAYPIFKDLIIAEPTRISHRALYDGNKFIEYKWFNDTRIDVFKLTKCLAKKVLMIDADYMIGSDSLKSWLDTDYPFVMFDRAADISYRNEFSQFTKSKDIAQRWATAMCWDHSEEAETIFETARMVRDNYDFYALMFGLSNDLYRNDLAFSIACHLHNIPVKENVQLWNLIPDGFVYKLKNNWIVEFDKNSILWPYDIHVLNKNYAIDTELMNHLRLSHA